MEPIELSKVIKVIDETKCGIPTMFQLGYYTANRFAWRTYKHLIQLKSEAKTTIEISEIQSQIENIDLGVNFKIVAKAVCSGTANIQAGTLKKARGKASQVMAKPQNHWKNRTRNIRTIGSNAITKIKIRLITEFNNTPVIY